MEENFLATTSLEKTWKKSKKILFLGEWCKQLNRKSHWDILNFKTFEYHWNDRKKLEQDYTYSKKLYSNIIIEIAKDLNNYHKISHTNRYWKILIGPWLLSFIQTTLERYSKFT